MKKGWNKERQLKYPKKWDEVRKKISASNIGKHYSISTEFKKGMKSNFKGKKHTKETIQKIKKARTKQVITPEQRIKMSLAHKGEKSHFWKGGIADYPYPESWTELLKDSIRERDKFVCVLCGIHQDELGGWFNRLDVHHIDYNKNNLDPKNLVSLCHSCHTKTNFNRKYWIKKFLMGVGI